MPIRFPTFQGLARALPALGFALGLAAPASAQVDYVREIVEPEGITKLVPTIQAPYETSRADYSAPASPTFYFFTTTHFYSVDSSTGVVAPETPLAADVKLNVASTAVLAGQNTPLPIFFVISQLNTLAEDSFINEVVESTPRLQPTPRTYSSLAARSLDGTLLSLIAGNQHFTADRTTGELIEQPLAGVDMSAAFYHSYGQDGLLYVLDYANNRMASFDPDNAFAAVGGFDLMTGIITANVQFAIGINGSFYLADGLGGGSYYNAAGAYQGTFSLPEGTPAVPYNPASYVSTDSAGRVYVIDSVTGFHQYQDASVVPEPGTWGLVVGAGALLLAARRCRRA
ncbi:hypothetical protein BH09VER1_BH09VER1_32290 [soil metagenome]